MYEITLDYRSLSYGNDRIVRAHPVSDKLLIDKAIKTLTNIIIVIPAKAGISKIPVYPAGRISLLYNKFLLV